MQHTESRFVWFTVIAVIAASSFLLGQSAQPVADLQFDVASVKPSLSPFDLGAQAARVGNGERISVPVFGVRTLPGGRFSGSNVTLKQLVLQAYDIKDYQLSGGPSWLTTDYFGIEASAGRDVTPTETNAMLKGLLRDRFSLRTHTETRDLPTYVLKLARSDGRPGSGLKQTSAECVRQIEARKNGTGAPPTPAPAGPRELPTAPTCGVTTMVSRANGSSTMLYGGQEVKQLLSPISSELSAPVLDQTQLEGLFDFTLEYMSERQIGNRAVGLDPNSNDTPPPPLALALERQLGLKLEKQTGPLPIVFIDSAEHPKAD